MKINCFYCVTILAIISILSGTIHGQNAPTDQLVKMHANQFEDWLIEQNRNQKLDNLEQLAIVVRERLKNRDGVPSQTLIKVVASIDLPESAKVAFSNTVLPYTGNDKYLAIELHNFKKIYLESNSVRDDSIRLVNALEMNAIIEIESLKLSKMQYSNYLEMGDIYFSNKDSLNALDYYSKALRAPFYLQKTSENLEFFQNIYVQASIGIIKVYRGDYRQLKTLVFYPSTYPRILPTYKIYIEDAGGRCELCDKYLKNNPPNVGKAPPPVEDKN